MPTKGDRQPNSRQGRDPTQDKAMVVLVQTVRFGVHPTPSCQPLAIGARRFHLPFSLLTCLRDSRCNTCTSADGQFRTNDERGSSVRLPSSLGGLTELRSTMEQDRRNWQHGWYNHRGRSCLCSPAEEDPKNRWVEERR